MRRLIAALIILAAMAIEVPAGETAQAGGNPPTYHFCVPPYQKGQTIDSIRLLFLPMLTWLGKQIGCRFDVVGAATYDESVDMLAQGKVHLAWLGPASYVTAKQMNPHIQVLVTELHWNTERTQLTDTYTSNIVSLKRRTDIQNLKDLKGKKFAFVDHISTTGFVYPNYLLREQGIIPGEYFERVFFLGSHPRVTDAVVAGSVDAGATWDFNLAEARKKHGDVFTVLLKSPPIPNNVIAAHPSLPADIREKIINLLPSIDRPLLEGTSAAGFVVRPDSVYDQVRQVMERGKK